MKLYLGKMLGRALALSLLFNATVAAFAQAGGWDEFEDRVRTNINRIRDTRVAGGDYDDRREEIQMRIQMKNESTSESFTDHKGILFVISESMVARNEFKVVIKKEFPINLPPREEMELLTDKKVEGWDNTDAVWGYKYEGYCLLVLDDQGEIVLTLNSPSKAGKFEETYASVKEGDLVDKKMKTIGEAAASRVR